MNAIIHLICSPLKFVRLKPKKSETFTDLNLENSKFLLNRGAVFQANITSTHYRQNPLVRGRLEISCDVTINATKGECTKSLLERHETQLNYLFTEPSA